MVAPCDNARFLCQKLLLFVDTAFTYLLGFFSLIAACIFSRVVVVVVGGGGGDSAASEEKEMNVSEKGISEVNSFEEEEKPEVYLKFKFPTYEEFTGFQKRVSESDVVDSATPEDEKRFSDGNLEEKVNPEKGSDVEKGKGVLVVDEGEIEDIRVEKSGKEQSLITEFCSDSDSESDSDSSCEHMHLINHLVDSYRNGFSNECYVELDSNEKTESGNGKGSNDYDEEIDSNEKTESGNGKDSGYYDEETSTLAELKNFENNDLQNMDGLASDLDNETTIDDHSEKTESDDSSVEDENELESLWEHQELVEQLKMEIRKVRATGLPTILEESESPKIMDDLKPWKIDEFQREDCIGELHKFYKSYRERMRKFDIINYQKMYAIGVLQLRDPLQFMSDQKSSAPTALKSLLLQKLPVFRNKIHGSDPMKKFIQGLQGDLEVVYVGQMCLSWEFLQWEYDKVLDLWDSDPHGIRQYNEVAGEFQQFQVLLQRFVEDEPFQDRSRMQNYVSTRGTLRNLLQIPVVRRDNMKDKRRGMKKDRHNEEYVITSDTLVEIVEESIRIFWRFVRADKDCSTTAISGHRKKPELSNPEDLKLLAETRQTLLKKERKLKDLLRSENCVLRKFRRCREDDDSDQVLYFFSQVDMKLVCRVLNMANITRDQLIWCHKKLDRISFVDRKIYVEPAFLLFPC